MKQKDTMRIWYHSDFWLCIILALWVLDCGHDQYQKTQRYNACIEHHKPEKCR